MIINVLISSIFNINQKQKGYIIHLYHAAHYHNLSNQHVKDLHFHFDLHLLTSESELFFLISACGPGHVKYFLCIRYTHCAGALTCLCCCSAWFKDKLNKKVALREERGCFILLMLTTPQISLCLPR